MEESAMESIAARLSTLDGLYFPGAFHRRSPDDHPDPSSRRSALLDLLSRDAPLFLERYGSALTQPELNLFDVLREDYEVAWHLTRLRPRTTGGAADTVVRNRRAAYMARLVREGEYFSEEAMRERDPYLHHEYLGKFQDMIGRTMYRSGERWSETLMRRAEEAAILEKIRGEQIRLGVDRSQWVGGGDSVAMEEMEEEEEDEDETAGDGGECGNQAAEPTKMIDELTLEDAKGNGAASMNHVDDSVADAASTATSRERSSTVEEEMQDHLKQFTYLMQHKFLTGEDSEHMDYSVIDKDESLDDHWLREANHDAEEKYFDED